MKEGEITSFGLLKRKNKLSQLPLIFTSCLPRSGSTLLQNLLGQNPKNHVTPTDDLIDLIVGVQERWTQLESFKAQGLKAVEPRIKLLLHSMIEGYHLKEFLEGKTVFNKSRGWLAYIELIEEILGHKVKVLVTVRDIRDMVASLELLYRKDPISKPARTLEQTLNGQTIHDRCKQYLAGDAMLGLSINRLKDVFEKGLDDRLIIIPYHELVNNTVETISKIHKDCDLDDFQCTTEVEKITYENDEVYGRPFHELRESVDSSAIGRWRGVLTNEVAEWLDSEYPSIQKLAHGSYDEVNKREVINQGGVTFHKFSNREGV
jgi:sulfotransferase